MSDTQSVDRAFAQEQDIHTNFVLSIYGQIESAKYDSVDNLYCKYAFIQGPDWELTKGLEDGMTQMSHKSSAANNLIVWNFPIEASFRSTNPFGWPQLIISVYGLDAFGRDVVRGYGWTHLPAATGRFVTYVPLFKPISSSSLQRFTSWLTGMNPEYIDAKFAAKGEGREITRTTSEGIVKVTLNVVMKDFATHRYTEAHGGNVQPTVFD